MSQETQETTVMENSVYSAISAGMGALTLRNKIRGLKSVDTVNEMHSDGEPAEVAGLKTAPIFTNAEKTNKTSAKPCNVGDHKANTKGQAAGTPTPSV